VRSQRDERVGQNGEVEEYMVRETEYAAEEGGVWKRSLHTFLPFSQTDICKASGQVAQTLIVAGLLVLVGHDCDSLLCISGFRVSTLR